MPHDDNDLAEWPPPPGEPRLITPLHEYEAELPAGVAAGPRPPRIAILGVHGVGHHAAGETGNAMADLLMSLPAKQTNPSRYFSAFRAEGLQIPLQPLRVAKVVPTKQGRLDRVMNLYQEQSTLFSARATAYGEQQGQVQRGAVGNAFTHMLLQDYQGGMNGRDAGQTK